MASETLADIAAEMRELAADIEAGNAVVGQTVWRNCADRVEAASKRQEQCYLDQIRDAMNQWGHEKYKAEHAPVGNSAAMREALEFVKRYLRLALQVCGDSKYFAGCMNVAANRCSDALAAPPRNCDMPLVVDGPADNNANKAWRVFKRHNPDAYFDVPGLLRCIDWLLAPAKEGGEK